MPYCDGRGLCFRICICECYDQDCGKPVCYCGHSSHKKINSIYCKKSCNKNCELVECKICKKKCPQVLLDIYNDMCLDCAFKNI